MHLLEEFPRKRTVLFTQLLPAKTTGQRLYQIGHVWIDDTPLFSFVQICAFNSWYEPRSMIPFITNFPRSLCLKRTNRWYTWSYEIDLKHFLTLIYWIRGKSRYMKVKIKNSCRFYNEKLIQTEPLTLSSAFLKYYRCVVLLYGIY